jgi:hypothetical protein
LCLSPVAFEPGARAKCLNLEPGKRYIDAANAHRVADLLPDSIADVFPGTVADLLPDPIADVFTDAVSDASLLLLGLSASRASRKGPLCR